MQPSVPPPPGIRRPVSVKMKRGWTFEAKGRRFLGPRGETFSPDHLPPATRVEATVPQLAERPADALSAAERDLAAYVQVVLPAGSEPETHVDAIRKWPCTGTAAVGPSVSLPDLAARGKPPGKAPVKPSRKPPG